MSTYEKTIIVMPEDLDDLDHVNNVRYVQWMQDVSKEHWQLKATRKMQENVVWVVMNHNIDYKSAAKLKDTIKISTHIAKSSGATSTRVVEMYNVKTNRLLVRSTTEWCLLSAKTFKPMRITEAIEKVFITDATATN